jgi:hypothetical protein
MLYKDTSTLHTVFHQLDPRLQYPLNLITVAVNETTRSTAKMKYTFTLSSLIASTLAVAISNCPAPVVHTVTSTAGSGYATGTTAVPSASASAVPEVDNGYFGVISSRSASPIHLLSLTARGGKFYLGGGPPSSYCPTESVGAENCPPGNTTVFTGGDNTLSLGVIVPGGQQVYVDADGSLSYTQAHSVYIPDGGSQTGFSREAPEGGAAFGHLNYGSGFVACPAGEGQGYQVYGSTDNATFGEDCLGFSALTGMFAPVAGDF